MKLLMFPFSEIKNAAKTAHREMAAETESRRTPESVQNDQRFYEFASRQFRIGTVLAGVLAVEEGLRVEFGGNNLAMAGVAGGMGALALLADRRASQGRAEDQVPIVPEIPIEIPVRLAPIS